MKKELSIKRFTQASKTRLEPADGEGTYAVQYLILRVKVLKHLNK